MATCPVCGKDVPKPVDEWHEGRVHAKVYECCGIKFRENEVACGFCAVIRALGMKPTIILRDAEDRAQPKTG